MADEALRTSNPPTLIKSISQLQPAQRNLDLLYELYSRWMKANHVNLIKELANNCLLSHFSDSLLLSPAKKSNTECLRILWQNEVNFQDWEGEQDRVVEFLRKDVNGLGMNESKNTEENKSNKTNGGKVKEKVKIVYSDTDSIFYANPKNSDIPVTDEKKEETTAPDDLD